MEFESEVKYQSKIRENLNSDKFKKEQKKKKASWSKLETWKNDASNAILTEWRNRTDWELGRSLSPSLFLQAYLDPPKL